MTSRHKKKVKPKNASFSLRIIGGQWRGRCLEFPDIDGLRPSGARIRETLFNWLAPFMTDARCLDLYAGSGALGFEALSRGAAHCTLIELNNSAATQLTQSAQQLSTTRSEVVCKNTLTHLATPPAAPYDIVFLDPPFAENLWNETAELLEQQQWLSPGAHIYVEAPTHGLVPPSSWKLLKLKKAGQVIYSLYYKE